MKRTLFLLLIPALFFACKDDDSGPDPVIPDPLEEDNVISDPSNFSKMTHFENGHFVDVNNNSIFPWGLNYTNSEFVGLIEDNWMEQSTWNIIAADFDEMKELGANIIRIHLQYHRFMIDVNTPNEAALDRLLDLVEMAEEKELYLDITGLAAYRKSDSPEWYDSLDDAGRWETHKLFWKSIAKKVGENKAVFAYNLMNEPVVSVGCDVLNECDWLPGDSFGGFHFVQNISRDPENTFAITMKEWIGELTESIRSEDEVTMITTGFLGLGDIQQFETDLSYVSLHIYPASDELQESVDYVQSNQAMPLVLEEISNLNCGIQDLEFFLDEIDGQYHGLLGHYHGKKIEDLDSDILIDAIRLNFYEMFIARNPN